MGHMYEAHLISLHNRSRGRAIRGIGRDDGRGSPNWRRKASSTLCWWRSWLSGLDGARAVFLSLAGDSPRPG